MGVTALVLYLRYKVATCLPEEQLPQSGRNTPRDK